MFVYQQTKTSYSGDGLPGQEKTVDAWSGRPPNLAGKMPPPNTGLAASNPNFFSSQPMEQHFQPSASHIAPQVSPQVYRVSQSMPVVQKPIPVQNNPPPLPAPVSGQATVVNLAKPPSPPPTQPPVNTVSNPERFLPKKQPVIYGPMSKAYAAECYPDFLCCSSGAIYRNNYGLLQCCGQLSFDKRYEQCVQPSVVAPKQQGMPNLTPAERLARVSCGPKNDLYIVPEIFKCCNGTFYDSSKFLCAADSKAPPTTTVTPRLIRIPPSTRTPRLSLITNLRKRIENIPSKQRSSRNRRKDEDDGEVINRELTGISEIEPQTQHLVCEIYRYEISFFDLRTWGCCGSEIFNHKIVCIFSFIFFLNRIILYFNLPGNLSRW